MHEGALALRPAGEGEGQKLRPVLGHLLLGLGGVAALLSSCASSRAQAPAERTEHRIGFRSSWELDPARTYRTQFDDGVTYGREKSPRPVLVNLWYPAASDGRRMNHTEYLAFEPSDPRLHALAEKLLAHELEVLSGEVLGRDPEPLDPAWRPAVLRALERTTPCIRDAEPAAGPFPLVLYHAGGGSSFEDNALLCEELAARGFVVLGGAFLDHQGESLNIDSANAGREFEFLLRLAADLPFVDLGRIAAVGHSAGAQGILRYNARGGTALDAIVALDTTQDYRTLRDPRWPELVREVRDASAHWRTPTLFVAGPDALFALGDTLQGCERGYLTVPDLTHNDFISQGEQAARARQDAAGSSSTAGNAADVLSARGRELRRVVIEYLEWTLLGSMSARTELDRRCETILGADVHLEWASAGSGAPEPGQGRPTPRTVLTALERQGVEAAIAEITRHEPPARVLLSEDLAFQLVYDLVDKGAVEAALLLSEFYGSQGVSVVPDTLASAEFFLQIEHSPEYVATCVRMLRLLGEGDSAVQAFLGRLPELWPWPELPLPE